MTEQNPEELDQSPAATPEIKEVKNNKKVLWLGLGVAGILAVLVLSGITVYGVYRVSENPFIVNTAAVLRLSVAKVNDQSILYRDYITDLNSLRSYYKTQPSGTPYTANEESDQVLSRLIANKLVAEAAREMNVQVTDEERDAAKKDILSRFDNDNAKLEADIKANLGLSLSEFYTRVLEPTLLEKKMAEEFAKSTDPKFASFSTEQARARHILFPVAKPADEAKVKAQAEKVLAEIKKGADFATKAKEYGTDGTKEVGGDLGFFGRGDMVKEFEDAVFALKDGELAKAPVKTEFGYHLIKLEEKRTARNFNTFMNDRLRSARIEVFGTVHNPFENLPAVTNKE